MLFAHVLGTTNLPNPGIRADMLGNLGVRIFFVISGFLITGLLLAEHKKTGGICLKQFYLRRTLRIFPAFYAYVLIVFLLGILGVIALWKYDLLRAVTYTSNYFPWNSQSFYVRHLWSLANEEQFYLLWPFCMAIFQPRRAVKIAAGVVLIAPFVRAAVMALGSPYTLTIDRRFDCLADILATGCLLALLSPRLATWTPYLRFQQSRWFLLVPVSVLLAVSTQNHPHLYFLLGDTVANLGIALCIDRAVRFPGDLVGRILNTSSLRYIGLLSYSLYLWQQLFLVPDSPNWWCAFPANLLLSGAVALLSFYGIELPFQRLKSKLTPRKRRNAVLDTTADTEGSVVHTA